MAIELISFQKVKFNRILYIVLQDRVNRVPGLCEITRFIKSEVERNQETDACCELRERKCITVRNSSCCVIKHGKYQTQDIIERRKNELDELVHTAMTGD